MNRLSNLDAQFGGAEAAAEEKKDSLSVTDNRTGKLKSSLCLQIEFARNKANNKC